jgi:tRNA uridine 5-carbamoylmethylation protein Kti12
MGTSIPAFLETSTRKQLPGCPPSTFDNIHLIRSDYRDWIKKDESHYDLIHVDIIHTFADTFACGLWSAKHAKCVIFHDTESYPAVKQAVIEIARDTGKKFYNFRESNGLGILV